MRALATKTSPKLELPIVRRRLSPLAVAACLGLAACATATPARRIADRENLLAAAGFMVLPANTHARQAELHALPPERVVMRPRRNRFEYVFADPFICNCIYQGKQRAYDAYRREVFARRLADEQQQTAMMYQAGPPWSPWGW